MTVHETLNLDFIDAQYRLWRENPQKVGPDWQFFFEGFEIGTHYTDSPKGPESALNEGDGIHADALTQSRVEALKYRYRDLGHLMACLDPLSACPTSHPLLALDAVGLTSEDLNKSFFTRRFSKTSKATLRHIVGVLKETYCRSIGVEFMHLQDPRERRWLLDQMEPVRNAPAFSSLEKKALLEKVTRASQYEVFLNKKYKAVTRFSLEGGEALIPLLDFIIEMAVDRGTREIIMGMPHRGRLNVQAHVLGKSYERIFSEFENCYDPTIRVGAGDVKYHQGFSARLTTEKGQAYRISMANNPSHLEAVDPVVQGIARARREILSKEDGGEVLPILIHGDAAFAGQGVVAETLNLSRLKGYETGGTLHIIINNQIGYTTLPEDARSTRYSTDIAKMLMVPIFHVHGENLEAVLHVARLATAYRMMFAKDAVIDLVCYRRHGHNEGDEPYYTQPEMYNRIRKRPRIDAIYRDQLIHEGVVTEETYQALIDAPLKQLAAAYDQVHGSCPVFPLPERDPVWQAFSGRFEHFPKVPNPSQENLKRLAGHLFQIPEDFRIFDKLRKVLVGRYDAVTQAERIDWATAEILALATLLHEGHPIRFSGQDVIRGTFSQRQSQLTDLSSGKTLIPLNHMEENQAQLQIYNSALAEMSILGFEYGYAATQPKGLTIWEAQFGDFVNNAQSIIDLFLAGGESKWENTCGLVLLLPHGFEGMGPEHSSARLERFLQLCAEENMQVTQPSTPAQYYHLLRRQAHAQFRKPLIVMTPKSLLRHPLALSDLGAFTDGRFEPVLAEPVEKDVHRILLCSGKIYYELKHQIQTQGIEHTAILRLEQYYPFPSAVLTEMLQHPHALKEMCWVQEEPQNMGAWHFVRSRMEKVTPIPLRYVGRRPAASPATGFPRVHAQEQSQILKDALQEA